MALPQEVRERIFAAADALHAASQSGDFPSVEAVRQESRASMNSVVEAMKEWRQNQRKQVQAVREPLPVELHSVLQTAGQSLWETAQQLANESPDAAKGAFETEKNDLIQLSAEQSEAFEAQAGELEAAQARIAELERQATAAAAQAMAQELDETRRARLAAEQDAALAKQRAEEIERRAAELRADLDHAHAEADTAAADAKATADSLRADADRLRTERDKARTEATTAREEAARAGGHQDPKRRPAGRVEALPCPQGQGWHRQGLIGDSFTTWPARGRHQTDPASVPGFSFPSTLWPWPCSGWNRRQGG